MSDSSPSPAPPAPGCLIPSPASKGLIAHVSRARARAHTHKINLRKEMSAFFSLLGRGQCLCLWWNKNKALPLVSRSFSYFILAGRMRKMIKMTSRVIKTFNGQNAGPLARHRTESRWWRQTVFNYGVTSVNVQDVEGCSYWASRCSSDFHNSAVFKSLNSLSTICIWSSLFLSALISCLLLLKVKVSLSVFPHVK